jgi:type 1 glutamine amidotransferase
VYIAIGHSAELVADPNYQRLLRNAILWAGSGN